jgi:rhamnogalacturonyl hydrolase YesR
MNLTRRQFGKTFSFLAITAATLGSMLTTGCNAIDDLKAWIPIALSALSGILKILGTTSPTFALIQAAFAAVLAAIQNYQSGTGVLSDIVNAIADVESSFQNFFLSLKVSPTLLETIEALATVIMSTIQAFANQISPSTTTGGSFTVAGHRVTYTAQKRSIKQFEQDWNVICVERSQTGIELK